MWWVVDPILWATALAPARSRPVGTNRVRRVNTRDLRGYIFKMYIDRSSRLNCGLVRYGLRPHLFPIWASNPHCRGGSAMSQVTSQRGRPFANGNPGRKPGSRNRASVVAAALLEGEAEEMKRTAVQLAKAGNVVMLKFLLGRLLPRDRLITFEIPTMELRTMRWKCLAVSCVPSRRVKSARAKEPPSLR